MQSPYDTPTLIQPEPLLHIVAVDLSRLAVIKRLNRVIFDEERVINTFEREDLLLLLAYLGDDPVGFKIGYKESRHTFYSAKGGVLKAFRRRGISRRLPALLIADPMVQYRHYQGEYLAKPSRFLTGVPEALLEPWQLVEDGAAPRLSDGTLDDDAATEIGSTTDNLPF